MVLCYVVNKGLEKVLAVSSGTNRRHRQRNGQIRAFRKVVNKKK